MGQTTYSRDESNLNPAPCTNEPGWTPPSDPTSPPCGGQPIYGADGRLAAGPMMSPYADSPYGNSTCEHCRGIDLSFCTEMQRKSLAQSAAVFGLSIVYCGCSGKAGLPSLSLASTASSASSRIPAPIELR